jgi:hypothetical protein
MALRYETHVPIYFVIIPRSKRIPFHINGLTMDVLDEYDLSILNFSKLSGYTWS